MRIAMIAPRSETVCTVDGTPYRAQSGAMIQVAAGHVAELAARGFRLVPTDWALAPAAPAPVRKRKR